jgi:hypothetical protein
MKFPLKSTILAAMLAVSPVQAEEYGAIHLTIPTDFSGVGFQLVVRNDNFEARTGFDTMGNAQFGAGLTTGDDYTASIGASISTFHKSVVPYVAASTYQGEVEVGVVSYDTDLAYFYAGTRINEGDDNNGKRKRSSVGEGDDAGNGTGGSDAGDNGDAGGSDPNGGDSGGDSGGSSDNNSGLGDGTNPGKGGGSDNSPNTGTDNPHNN